MFVVSSGIVAALIVLAIQVIQVLGQIEECTSPKNASGICIPIAECTELVNLVSKKDRTPEETKLLRDSKCGEVKVNNNRRPKVCCELHCGMESSDDRIYGGTIANIDQFPWMVLIEYRTPKGTKTTACGGSLVNSRYVLTAAHCLYPDYIAPVGTPESIRLGEFDKTTEVDCVPVVGGEDCNEAPVTIKIETTTIHPRYNPATSGQKHDIALVRLAEKAPFTYFIKPICLPKADVTKEDPQQQLAVAGWGSTETSKSSNVKRYLFMKSVPVNRCQELYGDALKETLSDKQMCAGGEKGKDSCRGDSGGPLMAFKNSLWALHGVVSFGPTPCATENIPGVYTKVFSYLSWIKANMHI